MVKRERHLYILDKVEKEGRVLTKDLVNELNLAEDTVRKDFQELSAQGKVQRFHGGILKLADKPLDFSVRIAEQATAKERLAALAVPLLTDKKVLYIDGGTTNLKLAQLMPKDYVGTVITNAPDIALEFCAHPQAEIMLIGGILNHATKVVAGSKAMEQLRDMNIECCVLGVSSVSASCGITYPLSDEAMLKREVIKHSKQVLAIATKNKIGSVSTFRAAEISDLDILVTDETEEKVIEELSSHGIDVVKAPEENLSTDEKIAEV